MELRENIDWDDCTSIKCIRDSDDLKKMLIARNAAITNYHMNPGADSKSGLDDLVPEIRKMIKLIESQIYIIMTKDS